MHGATYADVSDLARSILVALGNNAIVLDVELLLRACSVFAFDDEVSLFKCFGQTFFGILRVAGVHQILLEAVGCSTSIASWPDDALDIVVLDSRFGLFNGEHAGKFVVLDPNAANCSDESCLVRVSKQKDWLFRMIDPSIGKAKMILGEMDDRVLSRNVGGFYYGVLRPVDVRRVRDAADGASSDRRSYSRSVPHIRKRHIVDVLRGPENFRAALLTNRRCAENGMLLRHDVLALTVLGIRRG